MVDIYFDSRWVGEHGIGRFAAELRKAKINFKFIDNNSNPAGMFDVAFITCFMARHKGFFFSPGYNAPLFFQKRSVITVHDLNHVDIEHNSSALKKVYYHFVLKRACRNAFKVLTVSEFSKRRICEWANIHSDKVVVVGNGVSEEFNLNVDKYNPGYKYVLIVGNRKKHKNEISSLMAFSNSGISKDIKLILTGNPSEDLTAKINELKIEDRVKFLGNVSNEMLASLYSGAELLLFPSLYEGFGLPVVEAMACGVPVITSNTTSLPEIANGAACLVDPLKVEDISNAIFNVCNDKFYRDDLIKKGILQSRKYSWLEVTRKVEEIVKQLK